MARADEKVKDYSYTARKIFNVSAGGKPLDAWNLQVATVGSVGATVSITPSPAGNKKLYQMRVYSPQADEDSTLIIYKDSTVASSKLFDGYQQNVDSNQAILFPEGTVCSTKWVVEVGSGSGNVYINARYR